PARLCALGNRTSLEGTPRRVGEHLPNRLGVQFKLVRFYYAQRRAGRPRSSPRRFAAIVGVADNVRWATDRRAVVFSASGASRKQWGGTRVGIFIAQNNTCRCCRGEACPRPNGAERASVKPKRPKRRAFWFYRCVLAIQLSACADVTA
ncbi:MAG: hypothetical protein LBQ66_05885, partial [Planctomycetaceae bacterium]|nr:hypothetical protein [Planctomycetaceae bacterium]